MPDRPTTDTYKPSTRYTVAGADVSNIHFDNIVITK